MTALRNTTESVKTEAAADIDPAICRMLAQPAGVDDVSYPDPELTKRELCPVFLAGAQVGRLVAHHSILDHRSLNEDDHPEKMSIGRQMEMTDEGIRLLVKSITMQQATSLEGALAQVVAAGAAAAEIVENGDLDSDGREERVDTVRRCLHSIGHVLSAHTELPIRAFGSDYLLAAWADTIGIAWNLPRESPSSRKDKPTVDAVAPAAQSFVEKQLISLSTANVHWWGLYYASSDVEQDAIDNQAEPGAALKKRMADLASSHSMRIARANLIRAMELPATTIRELGLQAHLISAEVREWWDSDELPEGERACRALLARLIAMAGLEPILGDDLTIERVRKWLSDPLDFVKSHGRDFSDIPSQFNRALPGEG